MHEASQDVLNEHWKKHDLLTPPTVNVVNIRHLEGGRLGKNQVYVGRHNATYGQRDSILANPFKADKDTSRDMAIAQYEEWLRGWLASFKSWQSLQVRNIRRMVANQGSVDLVCWCAPEACHADIVAKYVLDPGLEAGLREEAARRTKEDSTENQGELHESMA